MNTRVAKLLMADTYICTYMIHMCVIYIYEYMGCEAADG